METTCLGAGMLAAFGAGLYASVTAAAAGMSGIRLVYQPDPPTSSAYDGLFEIYRQLYPRLRETFVQLHDLVKTDAAASI